MNVWMLRYLQQFLQNDFAEYNARPYQTYSMMAIQNLYDFAEDSRVKVAAHMILDYVSAKFAVSSNGLRRAVPFRRRKEFKGLTGLFSDHNDPQTSRFIILSGLTQRLSEVEPPLHAHSYAHDDMLFAAVGTYRVPDMILDLVMNKSHNSYYQRIYHGVRSYRNIPGGVELYSSSSPFLISGGGIWMESGHGSDEINGYSDTGWALPTTLMPTAGGIDRDDFIRINGNLKEDHDRVNTCVASSFACGLNPFIPIQYTTPPKSKCYISQGNWKFINASGDCDSAHKLGFYVAIYKSPCVTKACRDAANTDDEGSFGFFEATPSEELDFDSFQNGVLSRNGSFNYQSEEINEYVTVKGEKIRFIPNPRGNKYQWGIISINNKTFDTNITHWPLAEGDIINSDAHRGLVTIDNPFLGQRLVLDMRNPLHPQRFFDFTIAIRGVLLAGKFRTQYELNQMSFEDQRNTLIVELAGRTNQSVGYFQSMDNATLTGKGAVFVFLREAKIRTDAELKTLSDDDQRNTLIVELAAQTNLPVSVLQGMSNIDLVLLGLGKDASFIRGVLLAGKFRTQYELNKMSHEDQRNTLIVELAGRTNQSVGYFQSMDDATLAGTGAVLVFLREAKIRTDAELKTLSDDDQRNTLIVELAAQTHLPVSVLQGMSNMDLVLIAFGCVP